MHAPHLPMCENIAFRPFVTEALLRHPYIRAYGARLDPLFSYPEDTQPLITLYQRRYDVIDGVTTVFQRLGPAVLGLVRKC